MKDLKWAKGELRVSLRWWPLFIQRAALLNIPFLLPSKPKSKKTSGGA